MHLLVLDGSRVLLSLVRRLAPVEVEVESVATFDEALKRLALRPPEALIVDLTPADLPWQDLQRLCQKHDPPIPVLYESCVHRTPLDAGLTELSETGHFLEKPYSVAQLREEIERLMAAARASEPKSADWEPSRRLGPHDSTPQRMGNFPRTEDSTE